MKSHKRNEPLSRESSVLSSSSRKSRTAKRSDNRDADKDDHHSLENGLFLDELVYLRNQNSYNIQLAADKQFEMEAEIRKLRSTVHDLKGDSSLPNPINYEAEFVHTMQHLTPYKNSDSDDGYRNAGFSPMKTTTIPLLKIGPSQKNHKTSNGNTIVQPLRSTQSLGSTSTHSRTPDMFVLSSAPIHSFESVLRSQILSDVDSAHHSSKPKMSIKEQAFKFAELKSLFTLPPVESLDNFDSVDANNSLLSGSLEKEAEHSKRVDESIKKHHDRIAKGGGGGWGPSKRPENASPIAPSKPRNLSAKPSPRTNLLTESEERQTGIEQSKPETVPEEISKNQFLQKSRILEGELEDLVRSVVRKEIETDSKSRHYTRRLTKERINHEQATLEEKIEAKMGEKLDSLNKELFLLRQQKLNLSPRNASLKSSRDDSLKGSTDTRDSRIRFENAEHLRDGYFRNSASGSRNNTMHAAAWGSRLGQKSKSKSSNKNSKSSRMPINSSEANGKKKGKKANGFIDALPPNLPSDVLKKIEDLVKQSVQGNEVVVEEKEIEPKINLLALEGVSLDTMDTNTNSIVPEAQKEDVLRLEEGTQKIVGNELFTIVDDESVKVAKKNKNNKKLAALLGADPVSMNDGPPLQQKQEAKSTLSNFFGFKKDKTDAMKPSDSSSERSHQIAGAMRSMKANKTEIKKLETDYRSAMASLLSLVDTKNAIKAELKDWANDFEMISGRPPDVSDKAQINDRFIAYRMISSQVQEKKDDIKEMETQLNKLKDKELSGHQ